jgi:hypothetical protein
MKGLREALRVRLDESHGEDASIENVLGTVVAGEGRREEQAAVPRRAAAPNAAISG